MSRKVFVAYDFDIKGTLTSNLEAVQDKPPENYEVDWPGTPGDMSQGAIWKDIVHPRIASCDRFLAFVDLPNANVAFELGYALGSKKEVALARVRPDLPAWLSEPPLNGFICPKADTPAAIRALIRTEGWVKPPNQPAVGKEVLLLCPHYDGAAFLEKIDPAWGWRLTKDHGWDLHDGFELFSGVSRVVWIIVPHNEGATGRDGKENAALAILAGYAQALKLRIDIFVHSNARAVVNVIGQGQPFSAVAQLKSLLEEIAKKKVGPPDIPADRPKWLPPPPEDDWATYTPYFVGRELQLSDAAAAVRGTIAQASASAFSGGEAVRVLWIHGFGGMGKSWFLRRTAEEAVRRWPVIRVIRVEWDSPAWRQPLDGEPLSIADLFITIAWRLAQVCGLEAADAYWHARSRVKDAADDHRRLNLEFDVALSRAEQGGDRLDTVLLDLLQNESVWDDDSERRVRKLRAWRLDEERRKRVFQAWCHEVAPGRLADIDAAIAPERVLAEGLGEAFRASAARAPLLLLVDTCETLSLPLDRWLRRVITSLVQNRAPVLTLIGSQLPPDVAQPPGSRYGWRAEIPRENFRVVPFDENVRFTVKEIEEALGKLRRPVSDIRELAERLHLITRGVPLALRALLDLHEEEMDGSDLCHLSEGAKPDELLTEGEAVRQVVRTVAHRMLYHLERRSERSEDLEAIVALALLPRAEQMLLSALWPSESVRIRLRELAKRYSLLGGGDLHPTVREYLRRHWRDDENDRPAVFERVLANLERASAELPPVTAPEGTSEALWRRLLDVTLTTWRKGDAALGDLARALTVALAYENCASDFISLLGELPLKSAATREVRDALPKKGEPEGPEFTWRSKEKLVRRLRSAATAANPWSAKETACLELLGCLASAWPNSVEEGAQACRTLLEAIKHFDHADLPQAARVTQMLGGAAAILADNVRTGEDEALGRLAEEACKRTIELEPTAAVRHHSLGYLYHVRLKRPHAAEHCYLKAIELDPKYAYPHNDLGNLYQYHLHRLGNAERSYLKAIELDPKSAYPHNDLGNLYMDHLRRPRDAKLCYLKAIELNPKYALPRNNLGNLYQYHLEQPQDAERCYLEAIEIDPEYVHPRNNLGTLYQYRLQRPQEAEGCYLKAIALNPKDAYPHYNLGNLYQYQLARPQDAEPSYLRAIDLDSTFAAAYKDLGNLYRYHLHRSQDAERCYLKATDLQTHASIGTTAQM
jgi:tetratricopeptide (TPR) repeat protein